MNRCWSGRRMAVEDAGVDLAVEPDDRAAPAAAVSASVWTYWPTVSERCSRSAFCWLVK